jgi:hypothetical protein
MSDIDVIDTVRRRWCEVLDTSAVMDADDFFLSGGNSLLAVRLTGALRGDLGLRIPVSALFEARELGQYAGRVESLYRGEEQGSVAR